MLSKFKLIAEEKGWIKKRWQSYDYSLIYAK
jgi:hypothetical protein